MIAAVLYRDGDWNKGMKEFENIKIKKIDTSVIKKAKKNWDSIAKPLGSLGRLEELVIQLAGIFADEDVRIDKRCALIACADNGVVAEGVTQSDSQVTVSVAREIAEGKSNINIMGKAANADVYAIDVGMLHDAKCEGIINRKIASGTGNITQGPAMRREQALQAVNTGVSLVGEMKQKGYQLIVTGEMGIGNTTTSPKRKRGDGKRRRPFSGRLWQKNCHNPKGNRSKQCSNAGRTAPAFVKAGRLRHRCNDGNVYWRSSLRPSNFD